METFGLGVYGNLEQAFGLINDQQRTSLILSYYLRANDCSVEDGECWRRAIAHGPKMNKNYRLSSIDIFYLVNR